MRHSIEVYRATNYYINYNKIRRCPDDIVNGTSERTELLSAKPNILSKERKNLTP